MPDLAPAEAEAALRALRAGLIVGIPTDTVYGLAVDPRVEGATARLFEVKRRPAHVDVPVLVAGAEQAGEWAADWSGPAERLAATYWPGALTIVTPRRPARAQVNLGGNAETVGLRCPDHPVPLDLCQRLGPLATTSANRHGDEPLTTAAAIRDTFGDEVAVVIDGGLCDGAPSTVVNCTGDEVRLLREGRLPWAEIVGVLGSGSG